MQLFYPGISAAFSKALSARQLDAGGSGLGDEATLNGLFVMAGSAGRFAGPWIGAALLRLRPRAGGPLCATSNDDDDDGGDACCVTSTAYDIDGCLLTNASITTVGAAVIIGAVGVCIAFFAAAHARSAHDARRALPPTRNSEPLLQ